VSPDTEGNGVDMGAWGTAIFSDDTALDVREEWRNAILDGLTAEDATARLLESFDDHLGEDEDAEKLFWMALAAAQFETGRLLQHVRDRALAIIAGGGDVNRWREDGDDVLAGQRQRELERLAAKLHGPQPKPKRLRRRPSLSVPFEIGDVVRVCAQDGQDDALVVVVGHVDEPGVERDPVVAALDWDGGAMPDRDALGCLPILPDPYAPDRRLLIWVTTLSKGEVFGLHAGEVIASGVSPSEPLDPHQIARSMRWGLVPNAVNEARLRARLRTPD
jgi:Domain of unknown function (DUF4259)